MEENTQNTKESNSEMIPFDFSKLPKLQYIKVVFIDKNNELREIQANAYVFDTNTIKLYLSSSKDINLNCPTGVMLKFVTNDAIQFAKTILENIKKINNEFIFILKTPNKTIRQQNRKFYRINTDRPCVLLLNNDENKTPAYIAQSVNISKGGVLLRDVESLLSDKKRKLKISDNEHCHIAMFLKHNLKTKSCAKFIRAEYVNDTYRYAFQFIDMPQTYLDALDKYITKEELKILEI